MKKVLATFLVVVLAVGLVACGGGSKEAENKLTYDLYSEIEMSDGLEAAIEKVGFKPELNEELSNDEVDVWSFKEEVGDGETNNITLTVEKGGDKILGKSTNMSSDE